MSKLSEYTAAIDSLHFTDEQKSRIAQQAVAGAQRPVQFSRGRSARRLVLVAAAVAVLAAAGTVAGATGVLKSAVDAFSGIFGGSAAQTEVIDTIGHPVGASATDNGITITADAIIGDKYNACIVYTVSRDDGKPLLPEGVSADMLQMINISGSSWGGGATSGSAYVVDEDPSDNALQYVETISSDKPLNKGTATAEFRDLGYWDEKSDQVVPVAQGTWNLRFAVDYEDSSVKLGGGETFRQDGLDFTVDEITVSPVAVRVAYTVDDEVKWSNAPSGREDPQDAEQMARYLDNVEILLTKKDGTVISFPYPGGSLQAKGGKTVCVKSGVLEQLIPMEELQSVSVGGIVYPIAQ